MLLCILISVPISDSSWCCLFLPSVPIKLSYPLDTLPRVGSPFGRFVSPIDLRHLLRFCFVLFCSFGRNSEESRISNQSFVMVWREGQASLWLETDKPCFGRRRVLGPHLGQGSHFFLPRLSREWWLLFIPNTRHWSD